MKTKKSPNLTGKGLKIGRKNTMFEKFKENRQLAKLAKSDNWEDRAEAARKGYKPEKLAHDKDDRVRLALAENGYALDTLAADEHPSIRAKVAEKTTNPLTLAKLSHDTSPHVARAVAQNNYTMLDTLYTLAKHNDAEVRACSVANMDFSIHLDDLAKDSSPLVRKAVVQKLLDNGMSIDGFANDASESIRSMVAQNSTTIEVLHEIINKSEEPHVKELAKDSITNILADAKEDKEALLNSPNPEDRAKAASFGYGLDVLAHDKNAVVRESVARVTDRTNLLMEYTGDSYWGVRAAVAERGVGLEKLASDKVEAVRIAVAKNPKTPTYTLDNMVASASYEEKKAIINNHNVSRDALVTLSKDSFEDIAKSATDTLAIRNGQEHEKTQKMER